MTRTLTLPRLAAAALGAFLLVGATAACDAGEPKRDEPGGQITESSDASVFSLQVGDCVNIADLSDPELSTVPVTPCGEPHDGEVYGELEMPKGDFPGADVIDAKAEEFCVAEFETYVGIDYMSSSLDATPMTPLEDGWNRLDDRVIQCIVYTSGDPVTSSFKGTGL